MAYIPWWQRRLAPTLAERFELGGLAGRVGFKDRGYVKLTEAEKKAAYAKRFNAAKAAKDANFKKLVDEIFATKDFGNFKAAVTESQMRAAKKAGKYRAGTGKIPAQYIAEFNKAMAAGVNSKEFKELMTKLGRTKEEILQLNELRPGGKVTFDVRATAAAESYPEDRRLTAEEAKAKEQKTKLKRGDRLSITTGKAKYLKGTDKFPFHHIMPIGGEIKLTTDDVAIINKTMNSKLAPYNTKLNDIADAIKENTKLAYEAAASKNEADSLKYLKRVDELNNNAEQIVKKAVKELPPEYKKLIGFNKAYPTTNEYGLPIDDKLHVKKIGGVTTKDAKNLADLTSEEMTALKKKIQVETKRLELEDKNFLKKVKNVSGKVLKATGKVLKPVGYLIGGNAVLQAKAQAEEQGIDLKLVDYYAALEMGDANAAFDMWKMRNDPEFAAEQRAKTMAIPLDEGTYAAIDEQFTEQEPAATGVEKYIQITNQ